MLRFHSEFYLPSADGSDVLHRLTGLQLKHSAALHLLIPKLYSPTLFSPVNHTRSIMIYCSLINLIIQQCLFSATTENSDVTDLTTCLWDQNYIASGSCSGHIE